MPPPPCKSDMTPPPFIVFTDLDGTLLDHHDYSWSAALPALARLRALGVPVVLSSSKTAAEIAPIRAEMGLHLTPAIVENGAGVLEPGADPADLTGPYGRLRDTIDSLPAELRETFRGFGDMSDAEVAEITGLTAERATLARRRAFSEPGLSTAPPETLQKFVAALAENGVTARRGGRFLTLSFGGTKADRMETLRRRFDAPFSVALGDAPNDVEMLNAARYGFLIANPSAPPLPALAAEDDGRLRRSEKAGPRGWNECILQLISDLQDTQQAKPHQAD